MDRMESGLKTADSLMQRLTGKNNKVRTSFPGDLIRRFAQQIYLLQEGYKSHEKNLPKDAFLMIEATATHRTANETLREFGKKIRDMYVNWGKKRRMNIQVLEEKEDSDIKPYSCILAVSGFGCYAILENETGLHIWETLNGSTTQVRYNVRVLVAGQPDTTVHGSEALCRQAREVLGKQRNNSTAVVRNYREKPSSLVRDSIKKWRTGNLDKVLNGDFDLF